MQRCNCEISTGGQSISPQYLATGRARSEMPVQNGYQEIFLLFFFRKLHRVSENCAIIHSYITLTDGNRFSKFFFS